ncbi:MAG: methyltransferase domain-containing protein [Proteobacteria bacterium]|nr:methyltransferase domain-containing protein [Pseudomonadota bacterium]
MNTALASTMDMKKVNWNMVWREARQQRKFDRNDNSYWNRRAPSFARHTKTSGYARNFLRLMNPKPEWSILDVGCGAGTLAIPLAGLVQSVTAIDFSDVMISILGERCWEQAITNVTPRVIGWEDDWDMAGIAEHDVAIASRSLVVEDLHAAVIKLDSKARRKVFISSLVGDGPFDRRIFEAIGRDLDRGPDYICVYNLLHQMGIFADVTFVMNGDGDKVYSNVDEAAKGFRWMIDDMTADEEARLRIYLKGHLVKKKEGWTLSYHHEVRWAIISWSK